LRHVSLFIGHQVGIPPLEPRFRLARHGYPKSSARVPTRAELNRSKHAPEIAARWQF
jgi:hypothetical protein